MRLRGRTGSFESGKRHEGGPARVFFVKDVHEDRPDPSHQRIGIVSFVPEKMRTMDGAREDGESAVILMPAF